MAVKVIGKYIKSFTNKDTGEQITYARVFSSMTEDDLKKTLHNEGTCIDLIKCPIDSYERIKVGNFYNVVYNRYGGVSDFILCTEGQK